MQGLKSEDLIAIVDFLYYGEANIFEEKLETFLSIAEEFKLKGLTGEKKEASSEKSLSNQSSQNNHQIETKSELQENLNVSELNHAVSVQEGQQLVERTVSLSNGDFSSDWRKLDEKLKAMMIFGAQTPGKKTVYNCQVCGKEGQGMQIRDHIEANHLEGIVIPCNHCEKTFRSRSAMRGHRRIYHK